jgi:hypothetical protein
VPPRTYVLLLASSSAARPGSSLAVGSRAASWSAEPPAPDSVAVAAPLVRAPVVAVVPARIAMSSVALIACAVTAPPASIATSRALATPTSTTSPSALRSMSSSPEPLRPLITGASSRMSEPAPSARVSPVVMLVPLRPSMSLPVSSCGVVSGTWPASTSPAPSVPLSVAAEPFTVVPLVRSPVVIAPLGPQHDVVARAHRLRRHRTRLCPQRHVARRDRAVDQHVAGHRPQPHIARARARSCPAHWPTPTSTPVPPRTYVLLLASSSAARPGSSLAVGSRAARGRPSRPRPTRSPSPRRWSGRPSSPSCRPGSQCRQWH